VTGLNHAVTGALVAVAVKQPALALPLAFLSHFVIDAIPHYDHKDLPPHRGRYQLVLLLDAFFSIVLLGVLTLLVTNTSPWLIFACGLLGILPDVMWLPYFITGQPSKMSDSKNLLHLARRFHAWVQWSEGPRGLYVEIIWFVIMFALIWNIGR